MINYFESENLKLKRTFSRKLILIVPFFNVFLSFLMAPAFLVTTTFNWWSIIFMPLMIALLCGLSHQKEKKASDYRTILTLPVMLGRVWYNKIGIISFYTLLGLCFFILLMFVLGFIFPIESVLDRGKMGAISLLWITTLWEIPFCLFIAKKFNFVTAIGVNFLASLIFVPVTTSALWWLSPWGWSVRIMGPLVGVHPNGTELQEGSPLRDMSSIPIALILSLILFILLTYITGKYFMNKDVIAQRKVS